MSHIAHSHVGVLVSNQLCDIKWYKTKSSAKSRTKYSIQVKPDLLAFNYSHLLKVLKQFIMKLLSALNLV